jgi:glutamate synthase (NADPH/NADH) small chain
MEMALTEAERCIDCKKPLCIAGCPVEIDIPGFIREISRQNFKKSFEILKKYNALPAVCGRVCPQENQCEKECTIGKKKEPVGIGRLERFVADYAMAYDLEEIPNIVSNNRRVAIVGSGPGGLACAGELALNGYQVTIFEALHVAGGVLKYGIPDFRLPNPIIDKEIRTLKALGVKIELNKVIGKLFTITQLMDEMGFEAVFIATGAGFPKFTGIEGESLNGVMSANEFLTRVNLMTGYKHPIHDTPIGMGKNVTVIGSGNTAMDACRVSLRLGAETVTCVYRRTEKESPARIEELHHAKEEGVIFKWLTAPVKIFGDEKGWVNAMECEEMELGEPDESGRRKPIPKKGSNFTIKCDTVIFALGTSANPIIASTTPGLNVNKWGYLSIHESTGMTSLPGVFAGGDIVTGSATVIQAMGAGKVAARGIMEYLNRGEHGNGEDFV